MSPSLAALAPFIDAVHTRLEAALWRAPTGALPSSSLEQGAKVLLLAKDAKRARAILVRQVGAVVDVDEACLVDLAAAIELIHGASLLHDDVVDNSALRRGVPTANATRGNSFAVLCGDLVLSRAMQLLVPWGIRAVDDAVDVVEEMTRAALVEVEDRGHLDVPLARWRAMAEGKTGALFALCGKLPCHLKNDDARADRLARAFRCVGVAFQIVDDLNDLSGRDTTKPRGQDVREKNPSLPILLARQDRDVARVVDDLAVGASDEEVARVCDRLLIASKAKSVAFARDAVRDAERHLESDAEALSAMLAWTTSLVEEAA